MRKLSFALLLLLFSFFAIAVPQPPKIVLISPANYTTISSSANLSCKAVNSGLSGGTLTSLKFWANTTGVWQNVFTVSTPTNDSVYNFTVGNLTHGANYKWNCFACVSVSFCNNTGVISNWTFFFNSRPTINVTSPANGGTYNISSEVWMNLSTPDLDTQACWVSIDGGANQSLTNSTGNWNLLITNWVFGAHSAVFFCNDTLGELNSNLFSQFERVPVQEDGFLDIDPGCSNDITGGSTTTEEQFTGKKIISFARKLIKLQTYNNCNMLRYNTTATMKVGYATPMPQGVHKERGYAIFNTTFTTQNRNLLSLVLNYFSYLSNGGNTIGIQNLSIIAPTADNNASNNQLHMAIAFNQSYQVLNPTQSLNATPYSLVLPANATNDFKNGLLAKRAYYGLGFFLFGENIPSGSFNETQFLTVESTFTNETYPQLVYTWNQPINFTIGGSCPAVISDSESYKNAEALIGENSMLPIIVAIAAIAAIFAFLYFGTPKENMAFRILFLMLSSFAIVVLLWVTYQSLDSQISVTKYDATGTLTGTEVLNQTNMNAKNAVLGYMEVMNFLPEILLSLIVLVFMWNIFAQWYANKKAVQNGEEI